MSVRSTKHRRQRRGDVGCRSRCGRRGRCGRDRRLRRPAPADRRRRGRAVGDEAKFENSDEIWRSSRTWPRIDVTQLVEHRAHRLAAIGVDAAQVLGRQLDRRQRVLDLVRDLPRHLGPRLEAVRAFELRRAAPSAPPAMLLNASTSRRSSSAERTAMRASKSPLAMRRVARVSRRTGSAMRSAIDSPIAGAEQDEEQRREVDAAIDLVDLALDLALLVGERHGQDRVAAAGAHRRGGDHVGERRRCDPRRRSSAGAAARSRDRRRPACASAAAPTRTGRARSSRAAPGRAKMLTSWSMTWLIQIITSSLAGGSGLAAAALQRLRLLDDALRDRRRCAPPRPRRRRAAARRSRRG